MNKEYFPMLKQDIVYFDNAATTFKPQKVIDKTVEYYEKYCSNAHRGDYNIGFITDKNYEETRQTVKEFINAKKLEEIIFTSGATDSLNIITEGFFRYNLKKGDEVIISKSEHASNVLPWLKLKKEIGIIVKYIPLDNNGEINLKILRKMITKNTKVISLAYITNVVGDIRDMKKIILLAKFYNIYTVVDAAHGGLGKIQNKKNDYKCYKEIKVL